MGYRIQYGAKIPGEKQLERNGHAKTAGLLIALLLLLSGIRIFFPGSVQELQAVLLPGFDENAQAAFSFMVEDVRQGTDLQQAVSAFCQEIMENDVKE